MFGVWTTNKIEHTCYNCKYKDYAEPCNSCSILARHLKDNFEAKDGKKRV